MEIKIVLYSILRQKLPSEARGRTTLDLPEGSTLRDLVTRMDFKIPVVCALNGQIERDLMYQLKAGDEVHILRPSGGGSL